MIERKKRNHPAAPLTKRLIFDEFAGIDEPQKGGKNHKRMQDGLLAEGMSGR